MPRPRRAMRKIIEVLRLRFEAGFTHERIAATTRISKGAVTEYLHRAREAGLGWPLPPELDDAQLEALLFPRAAPQVERHAAPDFAHIHQELKRKGVTLMLLWEEYARRARGPGVSLQPVLPALSPLRGEPEALDAPGTPRRREALHRLLRSDGADHRRGHREIRRAADLRGGAGRLVLHLRRSDFDAAAARLDRLPRALLRISRRVPLCWCPIS